MGTFSIVYLIAISVVGLSSLVNGYKTERDLRRDLFRNYDKLVRPVKRASTVVPVKITIAPWGVKSMNEKDQILRLETLLYVGWADEYLSWDPTRYDGITELVIPDSEIWVPDICLYNGLEDSSVFPIVHAPAMIYSNGWVSWGVPFTINSICPIPFKNDVSASSTIVECIIKMGSWHYSKKFLNLQLYSNEINLSSIRYSNHKWKLTKIVPNTELKTLYDTVIYSVATFNVTLEKRDYDLNDDSVDDILIETRRTI